ncbi:DUF885 domain-containing protein [Demequina sp. SYSU T00039]|uniref:DUF885 domain-containing protein n=1 Tax=Demequina lignilytica TaxID=3051663 RepID=A0AAW7M820_9MICO|nr:MULTISPECIES: DUF885 domain-containing protein [unclassified Demequina]MDN4477252.1 DUF885 domain-containing protein [Demequina sp. SYSU T00039-1]MDN4487425.1 DUF885 domain-containing protein [Demequina sp. SYSU T00039]MDN4491178.1 DUF885 domain-containing protein [Demequina sp. SYSU T00068]
MDALTQLADEYYDYAMGLSPLDLMWDGRLEHLAEWNDVTVEGRALQHARLMEFARAAEAIDVGDDLQALALRDVVASSARATALHLAWEPELLHLNPTMGAWEMILGFIGSFPLSTAEHGEAYLAKLSGMPAFLDSLMDVAEDAAGVGRVALRRHLETTASAVESYLAEAREGEDGLRAQAAPTSLGDDARAAWAGVRDGIVEEQLHPACARFAERLRTLAERGLPDETPGLVHLEGGPAVYRDKMYSHLLIDITPEEVHRIGLAQVERLEDEYRAIAGPLLGTDSIEEIYARLRDDDSLRYTDADTLVADAERALAKANAAAPDWFAHLPTAGCTAHSTRFGAMAYYSPPDPRTGKEGQFYFKTSNPHDWATYELEAITYHEAVPGHHLQLALHVENEALHKVQREMFNTAYAEGWGLYTERLSDEMGLYSSELSRIGMLSADSLRACRLVVDTGIHALGWSREQAIQYVLDHSPMDRAHIEQEIDRYIGLPGQALAYMIGRLEILAIRAEAQQREGYDIRDFHDAVLGYGAVPLPTLRRIVLG